MKDKKTYLTLGLGALFLISQSLSKGQDILKENSLFKISEKNRVYIAKNNIELINQEKRIPEVVDVGVAKEENIRKSVRKAVELCGGMSFIKPGDTVLIKPNVNSNDPYPGTTNPEVLAEVIEMVKEKGAKRIIVADSSGIPWPNTLKNMETTGILAVAKKAGIEVYSLDNMEWIWVKPEGLKYWSRGFRIPKLVKEVDHIINVAVVKTHSIADFTMSLKNFVGFIHREDRILMHSSRYLKEMIGELNTAFSPSLNILDASKVFVRGGPAKGEEREVGMIIASTDRIACDITGLSLLKLLGTTPEIQNKNMWEHPQIKRAIELGVGINNPELINLKTSNVDREKLILRIK
ncbi:DUF362 domain-containing protein [Dictyoglomus thermophilum]|uniref:DUF362 domain-containing protein n=1 Tax=Dictyoglomus thermophilum (strain ATCC 35947 / DSM 3960 / H-6-12) TaxID=309799 RepID=B5YC98_DICT6|nr:DUF362 domain-containing protein [Dictyoglomus thermophilum]ACI19955.1 conserved hypothetical protein [Dictyoglomus thermophilum H-6-12]